MGKPFYRVGSKRQSLSPFSGQSAERMAWIAYSHRFGDYLHRFGAYFLGAVKSFLESLMGSPCPTGDLGHLVDFTIADPTSIRAGRLAFCL